MNVRKLSTLGYETLMKMGNIEQKTKCARTGTIVIDSIYNGTVFRDIWYGEGTKMFKKGVAQSVTTFRNGKVDEINFYNGDRLNRLLGTATEKPFFSRITNRLNPKNVLQEIFKYGRQLKPQT